MKVLSRARRQKNETKCAWSISPFSDWIRSLLFQSVIYLCDRSTAIFSSCTLLSRAKNSRRGIEQSLSRARARDATRCFSAKTSITFVVGLYANMQPERRSVRYTSATTLSVVIMSVWVPRYHSVAWRFSQLLLSQKYLEVLLLNNILDVKLFILQCRDPTVVLAQHALYVLCVVY